MANHRQLLDAFSAAAQVSPRLEHLMEQICERLHTETARYNWVGFYLRDKSDPNIFVLGPFNGSFSPLERISIDQGLCGAAVTSESTVVVNDVAADPRYLPGSEMVKSELVAPVFALRRVVAILDVNSYFAGVFMPEERLFIEGCAAIVGKYMEERR
ncbi:MAG TPA: GAF domain-containing protein [Candidatus Saccharimonadales bacterium]|jgi:L-methionine (R)-S-oxide reductase|nr:GAF domain-containing protein [Candidatus Saccharimonadales bacterium]